MYKFKKINPTTNLPLAKQIYNNNNNNNNNWLNQTILSKTNSPTL